MVSIEFIPSPLGPRGHEYTTALTRAMEARTLHRQRGGTIFLACYRLWLDRARGIGRNRRQAAKRFGPTPEALAREWNRWEATWEDK